MNKIARFIIKMIISVFVFLLIFVFASRLLTPYYGDSSSLIDGRAMIQKNSVDYLFLGGSQMFYGVDAAKLTDEYNLISYDLGESRQLPIVSYYYLQEALKTQKPKAVFMEVYHIYSPLSDLDSIALSWNYYPTKFTREKWNSLCSVLDYDYLSAIKYCFPLFDVHSRWTEFKWKEAFQSVFGKIDFPSRGYHETDVVAPVSMSYLEEYRGNSESIPSMNIEAIDNIAEICNENDIEIIFFKVPVSSWSRAQSEGVKNFMDGRGYEYLEINDFLEEININPETDFCNSLHMNNSGAEKTTDFLASYILKRENNGK